jgi:hypothetical protein
LFDKDTKSHFEEDDELGFEASKPNPEDWSECMEFDSEFEEELDKIISNPSVSEADKDFTQDVFNGTQLNVELDIPRDGDGPEYARVTKRLRDKDRLPIETTNDDLILDKRIDEVEYLDGLKA